MPKTSLASIANLPPVPTALRLLSTLTEAQADEVISVVQSFGRFDLPPEQLESLRNTLSISNGEDLSKLLASLDFLYRQSRDWSEDNNWAAALKHFLQTSGLWSMLGDDPDRTFGWLEKLLVSSDRLDRRLKREWLSTGIIDKVTSFASFVDLRPSYSKDRNDIDELVPTIIFSIETRSQSGEDKACVFQMTLDEFEKFSDALSDVNRKIAALRAARLGDLTIAFDGASE